jgi:hypothetical protein
MPPDEGPVRVLIRRPKHARVERLDGTLLRVLAEEPRTVTPLSRGGDAEPLVVPGASDAVVDLDADGHDGGSGVTIEAVRAVDHHGREAWEAILRPTAVYDPRCPCCPLLLSEPIEDDGLGLRAEDPGFVYPGAHRLRLDVGTGVCVANEQLGGSRAGTGHEITIEAVDEPMGDELFPPPEPARRPRFLRRP